ncbi:MAG: type IV secretory system conjugative DNA transfer family protein [Rhizomicrobium sp.]
MDEFQTFTTLMLANMMSELRKYGVGLTLAHQYMHQLEPDIRHAVLGNAGTIISFRVGPEDAGDIGEGVSADVRCARPAQSSELPRLSEADDRRDTEWSVQREML